MVESKQKFQTYLHDLDRQLRRERTYKNTNELVSKLTSQKKDLNDKITLHAIKVIQEMDPSKRAKGVEQPTAQRDLRMIFAGQHVQDQMKEYRLKKKIMHVSTQVESMVKREKIATKPEGALGASNPDQPPQPVRSIPLGTTLLVRNFDKIISRFEDHDPVFNSISREQIDKQFYRSAIETPAPGQYNPRNDTFRVEKKKEHKK
jgi:hypothetical protein